MVVGSVAILGSTGSIGTQTLDVIRRESARLSVVALAAGRNLDLLIRQILEFRPLAVSVESEESAANLRAQLAELSLPSIPEIGWGAEGLRLVATHPAAHTVVAALTGFAALEPVLAAIAAEKHIAIANKECLVAAGGLIRAALSRSRSMVVPVDSEHSSIFQCLRRRGLDGEVTRVVLTASGGPFLHASNEQLEAVTPDQAIKHPRWKMGAKISVDSATLMNKGLEVIEAAVLFELPPERIEVLIHPESIVHGLVEYGEGSVIAAMFETDMRVPIAFALQYLHSSDPRHRPGDVTFRSGVVGLDLARRGTLSFSKPDLQRFPALGLAYDALAQGGLSPTVLNAANEVAVDAFLSEKIGFLGIARVVAKTLSDFPNQPLEGIDSILQADAWGREVASNYLSGFALR